MFTIIVFPVCYIIRFLYAKGSSVAESQRELYLDYRPIVMSEEKLRNGVTISTMDEQMCMIQSEVTGPVCKPKKLFLKRTKNCDHRLTINNLTNC